MQYQLMMKTRWVLVCILLLYVVLNPSPVAGRGDDDGSANLFAEDAPMKLAFHGALISCIS